LSIGFGDFFGTVGVPLVVREANASFGES